MNRTKSTINAIKKASYVAVTFLILFCILSIFHIEILQNELDAVVQVISDEEFERFPLVNCHIETDEKGNNIFVSDNEDPQVYLIVPNEPISCIRVNFDPVFSDVNSVQLYYAKEGENLSEENTVIALVDMDECSSTLCFPQNVYTTLRLDVNGTYAIKSVEFSISGSNLIHHRINYVSLFLLVVIIVFLTIFEKKLGYYANVKERYIDEKEFINYLKKHCCKYKYFLRLITDIFKAIYVFCFITLLCLGIITKETIVCFFVLSIVVLIALVIDEIINASNSKPAKIFFAISLIVCTMLSYCMPLNALLSWDDEIHYYNSTQLRSTLYGEEYTRADENLRQRWTLCPDYIDSPQDSCIKLIYDDQQVISEKKRQFVNLYTNIGYLPVATVMFICDTFNINFTVMIVLSKFSNALVYSIIVYWGMKRLKSGQYILSSIALMPTCLFLASVFSYDYWLNAFTMYSISYLISELQRPNKHFTAKDAALMLASMFLGCGPKAIYFVMLIPFLFICKEKFYGKFTRKKYAISVFITACIIACSFMLPMIVGGVGSDLRGGVDVNGLEQTKFILTNPLKYIEILVNYIRRYVSIENLPDWFNFYAYLGQNTEECSTTSVLVMALCAFWDKSKCDQFKHYLAFKIITYTTLIIQIVLVCTALYITFTPVASETIAGVQGRYMFPLLFPFLYCLGSVRTKTTLDPKFMKATVFGGLSLNIIWCTYSIYIKQFII